MKLTFYKSAGVAIESGGVKLLCDPWLSDGAYYGSWAHVPPCDVSADEIGPVAGIYISHIHPDHLHAETLKKFAPTTPILIHRYAFSWLADAIRELGFTPVEVPNGESVDVGGLKLTIYAADNCNPHLCGKFFGCDAKVGAERPGSVQIDSLAVVDDGTHSVVNVNDCPIQLARPAMQAIVQRFGNPDFLLTNYVGAGPYPQCFPLLKDDEKRRKAEAKEEQFLQQAEAFVTALRPKAYMPFAGTYTLAGKLAHLNRYRGTPTQQEAARILRDRIEDSRCVVLGTRQSYDVASGETEGPADTWTPSTIAQYERDVLSKRLMDYEHEPDPGDLTKLVEEAGKHFAARCESVGYQTDTRVYVELDPDTCYRLPRSGVPGGLADCCDVAKRTPRLLLRTDPRLLEWLLEGPHRAHWGDASIGSHVEFERKPDRLERGLEFVLNDLHV